MLIVGLPTATALLVALLGDEGPRGVFQADVAGMAVVTGASAFWARASRRRLLALPTAALLLGVAHLLAGGPLSGLPAMTLLSLASATAASGLASVGRALGAPALGAGAVAAAALWVASTGIAWADDLAEALPRERRPAFRQAVLHLDAATACAYDAAGFDRFHDPHIYRDVPLAASLTRAPSAGPTGAVWLLLGVLAWGAATALGGDPRASA